MLLPVDENGKSQDTKVDLPQKRPKQPSDCQDVNKRPKSGPVDLTVPAVSQYDPSTEFDKSQEDRAVTRPRIEGNFQENYKTRRDVPEWLYKPGSRPESNASISSWNSTISLEAPPRRSVPNQRATISMGNPHLSEYAFYYMKSMSFEATQHLKGYWEKYLPMEGRVLDFYSSGDTYYPTSSQLAFQTRKLKISMCGPYLTLMNHTTWANDMIIIMDPNEVPVNMSPIYAMVSGFDSPTPGFDAVTNILSAHCLRFPRLVFGALWRITKEGGYIHLVINEMNDLDSDLAIHVDLRGNRETRLSILSYFLHLAG
ncbi:hypothetical protein F4825DRAFT_468506 [Nemania diffusa]|nr:hypothetical protein F4825DRAFT_468506 [Nemania diffusa]